MPTFARDGISFHYLDEGSGTPFVFQHGLGASVAQPRELAAPRAGIRFLSLDSRGHGETRPLGDPARLTFDTLADDVLALLDHLEVDRAIVGGISLGAGVALNFAVRHPTRALGLVLSRPAWLAAPLPDNLRCLPAAAAFIRDHGPQEGLARFKQTGEYQRIARLSPDSASALEGQFGEPRAVEALARLERLPADAPSRQPADWAATNMPTLILTTDIDAIHPPEYGQVLARAIPGAALHALTPKSLSRDQYQADTRARIGEFLQAHFT